MKKRIISAIVALYFFGGVFAKQEAVTQSAIDLKVCIANGQEIDLVYFAPDQGREYKAILLQLIEHEKKSIKAALFRLTDKGLAQALIAAYKRGVQVQLIFDTGAVNSDHYSLVYSLCAAGLPVFEYQATDLFTRKYQTKKKMRKQASKYQTLMHQKTFIFESTLGGSVVAFGSLNPTTAGFYGNEEAIQVRNKKEIVQKFIKQFEKIKARCHDVEGDWGVVRKKRVGFYLADQGIRRPSLLQSLLS